MSIMKKTLLSIFFILIIPCIALAKPATNYKADWQYVITTGNSAYYVDMNSPAISKPVLDFWMKMEKSNTSDILFSHMEFDSSSKKIRCVESYTYDSTHKKILSSKKKPTQWQVVSPNSPIINILEYIIKNHPLFQKESNSQ